MDINCRTLNTIYYIIPDRESPQASGFSHPPRACGAENTRNVAWIVKKSVACAGDGALSLQLAHRKVLHSWIFERMRVKSWLTHLSAASWMKYQGCGPPRERALDAASATTASSSTDSAASCGSSSPAPCSKLLDSALIAADRGRGFTRCLPAIARICVFQRHSEENYEV